MELETERLLLRPMSLADEEAWADFAMDAEATRLLHSPQAAPDRDRARGVLERWSAMYEDPVGFYSLVERESGEVVGFVGFVRRELDWGPEIELGWLLRRRFHGQGYATEAARALRPLVPGRIVSMIRVENEASQKVARKLGMEIEREVDYVGFPTYVFVSPRPAP